LLDIYLIYSIAQIVSALCRMAPVSFSAALDGSLCPDCDTGLATLKIDRMTLATFGRIMQTSLTSFADFKLSPLSCKEGQLLMSDALRCHLHRPLKSLEFLNRFSPDETS
jgi:DNA repair protein RecO (recombination protein O)